MSEYSDFIVELKDRADLESVVSGYVQVFRQGPRFKACCPLHTEKTPSFMIDPVRKYYHCFGCDASGDVFTFIQEMEKLDFNGAVEFLANKYNMEIPKKSGKENFVENKKKRDRLYALTKEAATHYHQNLISPQGKEAREYLLGRGITDKTITVFGLGYSINSSDLVTHLKQKGFIYEEMVEARVVLQGKNGDYYDPQNYRFITPIINSSKNVIAFGGRKFRKIDIEDETKAKYYNSMESFIFHKGNELFGQNILKEQRNVDSAILVEGYMDAISLYQAGITNAVASMGTALTENQAKLLKRFVNKVYFMYDGDNAGQEGIKRGVDILRQAGLDVYVVVLDQNKDGAKDSDEFIRKYGADAMKKKIGQAIPMYEYKINSVALKYNLKSIEDKGKFAVDAIEAIKSIPTNAQAELYINKISKMSGIDKKSLFEQFEKIRAGEKVDILTPKKNIKVSESYAKSIRFILYAAFGGVEGVKVQDEFGDCCYSKELEDLYMIFRTNQGELTLDDLKALEDENKEVKEIMKVGLSVKTPIEARKLFEDSRKKVIKDFIDQKRKEIAAELDGEKDPQLQIELSAQLANLLARERKLR